MFLKMIRAGINYLKLTFVHHSCQVESQYDVYIACAFILISESGVGDNADEPDQNG